MAELTALADGDVLTSAIWSVLRQQATATVPTGSYPSHADGRLIADTTLNQILVSDGAAWHILASYASWVAYTPTISASTTPPTGWTTSGQYTRIGKTVIGTALFTYGAGTAAVGTLRFGIPVTAARVGYISGRLAVNDSGTEYYRHAKMTATTYMEGYTEAAVATTGASPMTPAASDFYRLDFTYEAA